MIICSKVPREWAWTSSFNNPTSPPVYKGRSNLEWCKGASKMLYQTFHRLIRSSKSSVVAFDSSILKSNNGDFDFDISNFDYNFGVCISQVSLDNMADNNRTLKELATPNIMCQPWCIQYPKLEQAQSYELKSGLIHLLLKFHGFVGEDHHKHLKEFHVMCPTMRPHGILEDYTKMKTFPSPRMELPRTGCTCN
ncbi:hypothetical protein CR513_37995, partial [Mucuna pruriens]